MGPKFHSPRLGKLGDTHDRLNHVLPGQGHESDTSGAPAHWAWHTGLSPSQHQAFTMQESKNPEFLETRRI